MPKKRKCDTATVLTHYDSGHLLPVDSASQVSTQGSVLRWVDKTDAALLDELNDQFASMIYILIEKSRIIPLEILRIHMRRKYKLQS